MKSLMVILNLCFTLLAFNAFNGCSGKSSKSGANRKNNPGLDGASLEVQQANANSKIGLKSATQIYNTLLALTGLTETDELRAAFNELRPSLPSYSHKLADFSAGNMSAVFKLTTIFANALLNDQTATDQFFPGCEFSVSPNQLSEENKLCIIRAITRKFWDDGLGEGISKQQIDSQVMNTINHIITGLSSPNDPSQTKNLAIAAFIHVATSLPSLTL